MGNVTLGHDMQIPQNVRGATTGFKSGATVQEPYSRMPGGLGWDVEPAIPYLSILPCPLRQVSTAHNDISIE
jgi:hypothetical protein